MHVLLSKVIFTHGPRAPAITGRVSALAEHRSFVRASARAAYQPARALTQHPEPRAAVRQQPVPALAAGVVPTDLGRLPSSARATAAHGRTNSRASDRSCGHATGRVTSARARTDGLVPGSGGGRARRAVSASQRTTALRRWGRPRPPLRSRTLGFFRGGNQPARREPDLACARCPCGTPCTSLHAPVTP